MPKNSLFTLPFFACLALALLAGPSVASARPLGWHPAHLLVAQKHRAGRRVDYRKIACRPSGCFRIPLGCYPETEYDFWGNPTGYDRIVCPPR